MGLMSFYSDSWVWLSGVEAAHGLIRGFAQAQDDRRWQQERVRAIVRDMSPGNIVEVDDWASVQTAWPESVHVFSCSYCGRREYTRPLNSCRGCGGPV